MKRLPSGGRFAFWARNCPHWASDKQHVTEAILFKTDEIARAKRIDAWFAKLMRSFEGEGSPFKPTPNASRPDVATPTKPNHAVRG